MFSLSRGFTFCTKIFSMVLGIPGFLPIQFSHNGDSHKKRSNYM